MADIYIDSLLGSDDTGDGTESNPYQTLQRIINPSAPVLQPGDTIYFGNSDIGQPKYVYNLFDTTFWDDLESAQIVKLMRTLQYAVFAPLEESAFELQRNWYTRLAMNLRRFTSIFNLIAYDDIPFEQFRRRVTDVWLAFLNGATAEALNSIVGAYTYLPTSVDRLPDYPNLWVLGRSYLDQYPQENYILTRVEYRAGIVVDIFGVENMLQEEVDELLRLLDLNLQIVPFRYVLHDKDEPSGYRTINAGKNSFDNAILTNAVRSSRNSYVPEFTGKEIEALLTNPDVAMEIRTYPVDVLALGEDSDSLKVMISDRSVVDSLTVSLFYRFGNSTDTTDASWGTWAALERYDLNITLDAQYVQFRIVVQGLTRADDYEFYSIIVKGNPLKVIPTQRTVRTLSSTPLIVSGGRSPYTYSITQNQSGAAISATGIYISGNTVGEDIIQVEDSQGNQVTVEFTVATPQTLALRETS